MDFECAVSWNQKYPTGTHVRVRRVDGTVFSAKTVGKAQQWGAFAIVKLEEHAGMWTTRALSVVGDDDSSESQQLANSAATGVGA